MPLFTICVGKRAIVTVSRERSYLLELLERESDEMHIYLTTWTLRKKPVWDGNMKRISVRLATPQEASKFQESMLDEANKHPDDKDPDDWDVWYISAPIDDASHDAATQRIREKYPPGMTITDKGDIVPLH